MTHFQPRAFAAFFLCLGMLGASGCGPERGDLTDEALTSVAAVERVLSFQGYVYAEQDEAAAAIEERIHKQVKTAFGSLRIAGISVDDREFQKNAVTLESQTVWLADGGARHAVRQVTYRYRARALVSQALAEQAELTVALLMGDYEAFFKQEDGIGRSIYGQCINGADRGHAWSAAYFWFAFSAGEEGCQRLITEELEAIARERRGLEPQQIGPREYRRRFLPVAVQLAAAAPGRPTYPEYDQLLGVGHPGKSRVKVYVLIGPASNTAGASQKNDVHFLHLFKIIKDIADQWPELRSSRGGQSRSEVMLDPLAIPYRGTTYRASFQDLYRWTNEGWRSLPPEIANGRDLGKIREIIFNKVHRRWIRLEAPLVVSSQQVTKPITLEYHLLYGVDNRQGVDRGGNVGFGDVPFFQEAFAQGDVVLYQGHSYLGYGPFDPALYSPGIFPEHYQIFFFNSCVSFNYYGKDYLRLKPGGSRALDIVTNGLTASSRYGGMTLGRFITLLFDGQAHSWEALLRGIQEKLPSDAAPKDPNRSVDGEQDNRYHPAETPFSLTAGSWRE